MKVLLVFMTCLLNNNFNLFSGPAEQSKEEVKYMGYSEVYSLIKNTNKRAIIYCGDDKEEMAKFKSKADSEGKLFGVEKPTNKEFAAGFNEIYWEGNTMFRIPAKSQQAQQPQQQQRQSIPRGSFCPT